MNWLKVGEGWGRRAFLRVRAVHAEAISGRSVPPGALHVGAQDIHGEPGYLAGTSRVSVPPAWGAAPTPSPSRAAADVPRIFVSHARQDDMLCYPFAAHLRSALATSDARLVYCDECAYRDVTAPRLMELWQKRNERELAARPIVLVVLTHSACVDPAVREQIAFAIRTAGDEKGRCVIPLVFDHCNLASVHPDLGNFALVDFTRQSYDAAFACVIGRVRNAAVGLPTRGEEHSGDERIELLAGQAQRALDARAWSEAIERADEALAQLGDEPDDRLLTILARAYAGTQQWARARDAAQRGLDWDPFQADLWLTLGRAADALGQTDEAISAFDCARALTPLHDRDTRLDLLAERYLPEVRLSWTRKKAPDKHTTTDPDAFAAHAEGLVVVERYEEALLFARTLTALPGATAAHWLLHARLARLMAEDPAELVMATERVLQLMPDDATVARLCAWLLLEPSVPTGQLPQRLESLGFEVRTVAGTQVIVPPICDVRAGAFLMGSDPDADPRAYGDELPQHEITLPDYRIGRFPVTVAEYARFVEWGHRPRASWALQLSQPDLPVTNVSWQDAVRYAAWLSEVLGERWGLATEVEWEKAARWDTCRAEARIYPWGAVFDPARCNTRQSSLDMVLPVGLYPDGVSACGVHDMAGNIWEWTESLYCTYPLGTHQPAALANGAVNRVLRGGSARDTARLARSASRSSRTPVAAGPFAGFRLVRRDDEKSRGAV